MADFFGRLRGAVGVAPKGADKQKAGNRENSDLIAARRISADMALRCNARAFDPYVQSLRRGGERSLVGASEEDIRASTRRHVEWATIAK